MKWILSLVLCLSIFSLHAQDAEFSTIYFIEHRGLTSTLFINEQKVATISNEILEYKLFSTGRLTITCVMPPYPTNINLLEVEKGKSYYYDATNCSIVTLEKDAKRISSRVDKKFKLEEDLANPFNPESVESIKKGPSQGTCFLMDSTGLFVTNFHVIEGAEKVFISGMYGDYSSQIAVDVIAIDVDNDFALLKLKNPNFKFDAPPYTLATDVVPSGTGAFVLGYPMANTMGSEAKLTDGLISAKSGFRGSISQYQFSAPVQPGNSGSPLLSKNGEVLGVATAIHKNTDGVAYASKSQYLSTFLKLSGYPFAGTTNKLSGLDLAQQTELLKNFIFIVKTE